MQQIIILIVISLIPLVPIQISYGLPQTGESKLAQHEHVPLVLIMNGHNQTVPYEIGIRPDLWKAHLLDKYRGLEGESPLHTHETNGRIHVESNSTREFTFGEFLDIWGIDKDKIIKATSNGTKVDDYRNIVLKNGKGIELYIDTSDSSQHLATLTNPDLSIQYPSNWVNVINNSTTPPECFMPELGESFSSKIGFFPAENDYLDTPQFHIDVYKLPNKAISLNDYTSLHMKNLSNFTITQSSPIVIANNPGHKMVLEYYGYPDNQLHREMQAWTIHGDKLYLFTYDTYSNTYPDYLQQVMEMINSFKIKEMQPLLVDDTSNFGITLVKNYGCMGSQAVVVQNITHNS